MTSKTVVPYNPSWPCLFEEESQRITKTLNCIEIHHVGSTSIPGLKAKPVIDMIVVVKDLTQTIEPLESLGYKYKGEYNIPFRKYFSKSLPIKAHLHVYEEGNPEIELNLFFRNYLREHPEAVQEYATLKDNLLKQEDAFNKKNSMFAGYTLGKNDFIQKVLKQTDFKGLRMLKATHFAEWDAVKFYREEYFFGTNADPHRWTFEHPNHIHFVLYEGMEIIGYTHLQLWPNSRACMRIIVLKEHFRKHGYGKFFLTQCEKWLKQEGYISLHIEASPEAFEFYQKQGYHNMSFNDPDGYEGGATDIEMGKIL